MKKTLSLLLLSNILYANDYYLDKIEVKENKDQITIEGDSSKLLHDILGMSFKKNGGIATIPQFGGLSGDRIKTSIDGGLITSSCSNHMNPPLSYLDSQKIEKIEVLSKLAPVSYGGDSLGGTIEVKTKRNAYKNEVTLGSFYKSNSDHVGASIDAEASSGKTSLSYQGFQEKSQNYRDSQYKRVRGSLFEQNNQMFTFSRKINEGQITAKYSQAIIPHQGFTNQYMDMTHNLSNRYNFELKKKINNINFEGSSYFQNTSHEMNKISTERNGHMPMRSRSYEYGLKVLGKIENLEKNNFIFGSEFTHFVLDDWWPPAQATGMMGPNKFESINKGHKKRTGLFIENNHRFSEDLKSSFGIRSDLVQMETSDVSGYNNMNSQIDAKDFNDHNKRKDDLNLDSTLSFQYQINSNSNIEFGISRKTRTPNLYERFSWAGRKTDPTTSGGVAMDMRMINWFGDGNGYVGDINLKPETAHSLSAKFSYYDSQEEDWIFLFNPYYSEISNFIDADLIGRKDGRSYLKFSNHDAAIFGGDLSLDKKIKISPQLGNLFLKTTVSYVRGYRHDHHADLYQLMPLNGKVSLTHYSEKLENELTFHLVDSKKNINKLRNENKTAGYAIINYGLKYKLTKDTTLTAEIDNILNKEYYHPLGGKDLINSAPSMNNSLVSMGRSLNSSIQIKF